MKEGQIMTIVDGTSLTLLHSIPRKRTLKFKTKEGEKKAGEKGTKPADKVETRR